MPIECGRATDVRVDWMLAGIREVEPRRERSIGLIPDWVGAASDAVDRMIHDSHMLRLEDLKVELSEFVMALPLRQAKARLCRQPADQRFDELQHRLSNLENEINDLPAARIRIIFARACLYQCNPGTTLGKCRTGTPSRKLSRQNGSTRPAEPEIVAGACAA